MTTEQKPEQLSFLEAPPPQESARKAAEKPADILSTVQREDLPESLRRLCDLLGLPKVIHLVRTYGGTRLHVPHCAPDDSPLCRVIGKAPARLLGQHYGGDDLYIPGLARFRRHIRDHRIRRDYDGGATVRDLALREGLSERRITGIINSPEAA